MVVCNKNEAFFSNKRSQSLVMIVSNKRSQSLNKKRTQYINPFIIYE